MAASKEETEERVFEALASGRRRQMLALLESLARPSLELHLELPEISWPTLSRHLRVLEKAGLVRRYEGELTKRPVFGVREEGLEVARRWLERFQ